MQCVAENSTCTFPIIMVLFSVEIKKNWQKNNNNKRNKGSLQTCKAVGNKRHSAVTAAEGGARRC